MKMLSSAMVVVILGLAACGTNKWVLKDPPQSCAALCGSWGMELAAIVGVGEQSRDQTAQGATACVCRPPIAAPTSTPAPAADPASPAPPAPAPVSLLSDAEYQAAGYAAIPPEIRRRDAAAAQQQQQQSTRR